ncbi:MAG: tetratricopeptide repeat protein [Elusimicrobiota bacterium]
MGKNRRAPATAPPPRPIPPDVRLWAAFLVVSVLIAYASALHGGFLWDDDVYVSRNLLLTASDGLRRIWFSLDSPSQYFPLTYTTFLVERGLWGLNTFGYHLVNVGLHAANALLVWWILAALDIPGAWLAAGIFALHPVQVESVAWITERKNVLSTFFYLLSLRCWMKTLEREDAGSGAQWAAALVFFLLALFSKTTACTLPAALVLAAWIKGRGIDRRRALRIASFVAVGLGMGLLTVWWERHQQGASGGEFGLTRPQAVIVAGRALWFYAGKLLWPSGLCFIYPHWTSNPDDWRQWLWPGAAAALFGALAWLWRRGRPEPAYAALFFAATLSPLLGFIPLYTFRYAYVADHYQYLACLGPIALFSAAAVGRLFPEDVRTPRFHPALLLLFAALLFVTSRRAAAYGDAEALWRDTLANSPDSFIAYSNLGCVLTDKGHWSEAEADLKKAISLEPADFRTRYDLGYLYEKESRRDDAVASYQEAVRLEPDHVKSRLSLARLLAEAGRDEEAAAQFREGLKVEPAHADARNSLGMILARLGRGPEAAEQYKEAIRINPRSFNAHNNLANAYLKMKLGAEAVAEYHAALEINPNFPVAHYNLAVALEQEGKLDEAAGEYGEALRLRPEFTQAKGRLEGLHTKAPR